MLPRPLCLFFWLAILLTGQGCGQSTSLTPIYFGHVASLSGPAKEAGEQAARGIRLALEELNQDPKERPFHVRHADAQGNPAAFEALAVRLTSVNHTAALLGGDTADQIAKLARAEALVMSPAGHRPPGLGELVYTIGLSPEAQGQALGRFAREEMVKDRWILLVDETNEATLLLAQAFETALSGRASDGSKKPSAMVSTIRVGKNSKWSEVETQIVKQKTEAILHAAPAGDMADGLAVWTQGTNLLVFAGEDGLPTAFAGTVYRASAYWPGKDQPLAEAFAQKYREAFQSEPKSEAAVAYEGTLFLGQAFRDGPVLSVEKVREALNNKRRFAGLLGQVSFGKDQHLRRPVAIVRWSGKTSKLEKVYPAAE